MPNCRKRGFILTKHVILHRSSEIADSNQATEQPREPKRRKTFPFGLLAAFLALLLLIAAAISVLAFFPFRTAAATETRYVDNQLDVETLSLDLTADVARINVSFEGLMGKLITLNVSATGKAGLLPIPDLFTLTLHNTTVGSVLKVSADIDAMNEGWPRYSSLRIDCDLHIDPSIKVRLDIETEVGTIVVGAETEMILEMLSLETTTGEVEVNLDETVNVTGDISLKTATGPVGLSCDTVDFENELQIDVETTTGEVNVNITQNERFNGNVTLSCRATVGDINFLLDMEGETGARIDSSVTTGSIEIVHQVGFSGSQFQLQSNNYRAPSNFDVGLETSIGEIEIYAQHMP